MISYQIHDRDLHRLCAEERSEEDSPIRPPQTARNHRLGRGLEQSWGERGMDRDLRTYGRETEGKTPYYEEDFRDTVLETVDR